MSDVSVLFVCLGNICRSPTADGLFQKLVADAGLSARIAVDSAGTGAWHAGEPPDKRMTAHARKRGIDLTALRARQAKAEDFRHFDWILAMDHDNLGNLRRLDPGDGHARLHLMGEFSTDHGGNPPPVPDPYYGGAEGFETVLDMLEDACSNLLARLKDEHGL